jgi:hypothetical protein
VNGDCKRKEMIYLFHLNGQNNYRQRQWEYEPCCLVLVVSESAFHRTVLLPQSLIQDEYTSRVNTSMSLEDDWNLETTSKVWNKAVFCEY